MNYFSSELFGYVSSISSYKHRGTFEIYLSEKIDYLERDLLVQAAKRLVCQDDQRLVYNCPGNGQLFLSPAEICPGKDFLLG